LKPIQLTPEDDLRFAFLWWATMFCWKWQVGHGIKRVEPVA